MEPLKRKYSFSSFEEAIAFIDQVAPIFSRENHHPQITNFTTQLNLFISQPQQTIQ